MQTTLKNALPILAVAYGEQFGTKIVVGGSQACTDGHTIWLPLIDDPDLRDVVVGYLGHESGHIKYSRFDLFRHLETPLLKRITNILEDPRIERRMIEEYPGMRLTLTAVMNHLNSVGMLCPVSSSDNEARRLTGYLLYRCRYEQWGFPMLKEKLDASEVVLRENMPPGFFVRLEALLDRYFDSMVSTMDAIALARAILKAVAEAEEEAAQNSPPDQPDLDSEDEPLSEESSNESQDDSQSGGDGDSESDESEAGDSSSSDASVNDLESQAGDSDPQCGDTSDEVETMHSGTGADDSAASDESMLDRMSAESDVGEDLSEVLAAMLEADADSEHSVNLAPSVGAQFAESSDIGYLGDGIQRSAQLRGQLLSLLQAETRENRWLAKSGRRIDGRKLHRVRTGSINVFERRNDKTLTDTGVHILVDRSGSMSGREQVIANQASVALALAVSSIPRCDVAISCFPGRAGNAVSPAIRRGQPVRSNLGLVPSDSTGGTPMGQAMLFALSELAAVSRARKVLIIITDGYPADPQNVTYLNDLSKTEVETYAIGIASDGVKQLFEKAVVIGDVEELQQALFRIARDFLKVA